MAPFTQEDHACRCEWCPDAVAGLAPADVIIVVDVFSFTTCVEVAYRSREPEITLPARQRP